MNLSVPGPDYVFEDNYPLPSLHEVKQYIDEHKHLPEVPPAKDMEENGVDLGEMNMILLKKVEELTLYLIEQDKLVGQLREELNIRSCVSGKKIEELTLSVTKLKHTISELQEQRTRDAELMESRLAELADALKLYIKSK